MSYRIYFHENGNKAFDKGVSWRLSFWNEWEGFSIYTIEVTINPKILSDIVDYVTAANQSDLYIAVNNYFDHVKKISKSQSNFGTSENYTLKRIDYCINFYLPELNIHCTSEQMMELLKKGNIPNHYDEWMEYDIKSHRMKSSDHQFYLKSNSTTINCYNKHYQLMKNSPTNPSLQDSLDVIRFEVQCKYKKVYDMVRKYNVSGDVTRSILFSVMLSKKMIDDYYKRTIMPGNYYTLSSAITEIKKRRFRVSKESRMIETLKFVSQRRSISKAKEKLSSDDSYAFGPTLRELSLEEINPVTIPRNWGIKFIPNLLSSYYDRLSVEKQTGRHFGIPL